MKIYFDIAKNSCILIELHAIALNYDSNMFQIKVGYVQVNTIHVIYLTALSCCTLIQCMGGAV